MGPVVKRYPSHGEFTAYLAFLANKARLPDGEGIEPDPNAIHRFLHPWQQQIVRWALRTGRAAIWADTGLGKTVMQIEWAKHIAAETGLPVLVAAPLAVAHQTVREGGKVDCPIVYVRNQGDVTGPGVWITNYGGAGVAVTNNNHGPAPHLALSYKPL